MEAAAAASRAATVPLTEALGAPATSMEVWDGERFVAASWDRTAGTAERVAAGLRALGVEKGTRVAAVLTNSFGACTGLLGTWMAGGVPVSLPTPARGMPLDAYAGQLGDLAQQAGARLLLVDPEFVAALESAVPDGVDVRSYESLPAGGAVEHTPPAGEDVALIQYSSGSTTSPKGCVLSARAIVTHIDLLGSALGIDKGDRGAFWLPLSHDMGLFGALLMGWMRGMELRVGTPQRFLGNARTWMRDCADWQATFTVTPNFGLRIAARAAARRPEEIGTFPLRACIIGSDRIELSALEDAAGALSRYGLTFETLTPAYGLAEATLAVTTTAPAAEPHAIEVDAAALRAGEVREPVDDAPTRLVSCGVPLEGVEVRIDGAGTAGVGEICVRSPCLASGYAAAPERTATAFRDGELWTGDLGFLRDGELYVVGRKDDVITMGGRNVYASELETVLGSEDGVRRGNCVLLEMLDGDRSRLVVLAEPDRERSDYDEVALRLRAVVAERSGLGTSEVVFVVRDSLPKTASGKIQRYRARRLAGSPDLDPVARVRFD